MLLQRHFLQCILRPDRKGGLTAGEEGGEGVELGLKVDTCISPGRSSTAGMPCRYCHTIAAVLPWVHSKDREEKRLGNWEEWGRQI